MNHIKRMAPAVVVFCAAAGLHASYSQTVLDAGPVAYWRFTSMNDVSVVNGLTSVFQGNATLTAAGGGAPLAGESSNRALQLDGAGDYVNTGLDTEFTFPAASTIIAWINLSALPSTTGRIFTIVDKTTFSNDYALQLEPTSNRLRLYSDTGSASTYIPTAGTLLDQWHFVAATFDEVSDFRRIYWDGALVVNDVYTASHNTNTIGVRIGEGVSFTNRFFQGRIDEVALYDRALSTSEISGIYASSVPEPMAAGTIALGLAGMLLHRRRAS